MAVATGHSFVSFVTNPREKLKLDFLSYEQVSDRRGKMRARVANLDSRIYVYRRTCFYPDLTLLSFSPKVFQGGDRHLRLY
jgi:hypothetical protein